MKKMISLARVGISLLLAIIICSLFCLVYSYNMLHITAPTGASDLRDVPNSFCTNMIEGYGWIRMDANGYNNVEAYDSVDVLVMGGSHVQGWQVSQKENLTYRLDQYLQKMTVYNVGESGHPISTCINNLDNACGAFSPNYVVIDINISVFDMDDMEHVLNGTYPKPVLASDHLIYRVIRNGIPAVAPVILQLQKWIQSNESEKNVNDTIGYNETAYGELLDRFLDYAEEVVDKHNCKLIFLYHPSNYSVNSEGILQYEDESEEFNILQASCDEHNIILVNTKEENIRMYEEQRVLPNGFVNTSLGKGHLNRYGHEAAAKVLADTIMELERNAD